MKKRQEQATPYVAIPNKFFAAETEHFVTNDEWILFYHIGTLVSARDTLVANVNVELLHTLTNWSASNPSRGKDRIKEALIGLRDKGYIKFQCEGKKPKNTAFLQILLPEEESPVFKEATKSKSWTYKGFTKVYEEMFAKTSSVIELKVLTYVTWRLPIKHAISYSEWESVLDVCHQTAVKIIEQCHARNLIIKMRGDYYLTDDGEPRQETNKYLIPSEIDPVKEVSTRRKATRASNSSTERREHQWFEMQTWLGDNDFYVYVTTSCEILKEHAERRVHAISATGSKNRERMHNALDKAKARYQHELIVRKQRKEVSEAEKEQILEEYNTPQTFKPRSMRNTNNDYSDLLDGNDSTDDESEDDLAALWG